LKQICSNAFAGTKLSDILLPVSICFLEPQAVPAKCRISLTDGCFSPDFERWCLSHDLLERRYLKRIVNRVGLNSSLESFVLDLSGFECGREIELTKSGSGSGASVKQYSRLSDGFEIVVKSFDSFDCKNVDNILYELLLLTQLRHRCIAPLIGFVLPTNSTSLKIATLYYRCGSLKDVLDKNPVWWTPTVKAKTIAGIALGMKSAHELGIVHGSLTLNNILFDEDHCVHIVDFCSSRFRSKPTQMSCTDADNGDVGVENAKRLDMFAFTSIMLNILVDRRRNKGKSPMIPRFVSDLITNGRSQHRYERYSFENVTEAMKENIYMFREGVDVCETLEFVNTVEESSF
jgi:serine/threonine protein kinase